MKKYLSHTKPLLPAAIFLLPVIVLAGNPTPTTFGGPGGLVSIILGLINIIVPTIFGVLFVVIMVKIINAWVINGADETKRQEGKQLIPIAVLVFVLMLVIWGVIALLRSTFGFA